MTIYLLPFFPFWGNYFDNIHGGVFFCLPFWANSWTWLVNESSRIWYNAGCCLFTTKDHLTNHKLSGQASIIILICSFCCQDVVGYVVPLLTGIDRNLTIYWLAIDITWIIWCQIWRERKLATKSNQPISRCEY